MDNSLTISNFTNNFPTTVQSHSAIVESARANKEIEASVLLAKRYPRDEKLAVNRIINSCSRVALAENSIYSFRRGGQTVEGPTIRLAEVIARSWGNLQFGVKEVERAANHSIVEAFCWDLETNVRSAKEFSVLHVRDTKQGQKQLTNERDIYETVANQGARRLRNCILSCIPEDVLSIALENVNHTLLKAAQGTAIDMQARIRTMIEAFQELKVTRAMLEEYLGSKPEAATDKQIVALQKAYASLKGGHSEIDAWFKMPDMATQIVKEDVQKSNAQDMDKLNKLIKQAEKAGVAMETINNICRDLSAPSKVSAAIDFLQTVIADKISTLQKPDSATEVKTAYDKLKKLLIKADEIGIPESALEKVNPESNDLESIKAAISQLNIMIATKLGEK